VIDLTHTLYPHVVPTQSCISRARSVAIYNDLVFENVVATGNQTKENNVTIVTIILTQTLKPK